MKYLPAVARRLHHSRDLGEPFDFLTWFEFALPDAAAFEDLVAEPAMKVFVTGLFLAFVVATEANANCSMVRFHFFPAQNDSVSTTVVTDGKACSHRFRAGGTSHFSSASIVTRASHGVLSQSGLLGFRYVPAKGFKGADQYALKVCGTSNAGSGCSTVTYNVTVQ